MVKKPEPVDALDAEVFDLDAWIDETVRPAVTVELYPREAEFLAEADRIEKALDAAEKVPAEDRGMGDASPTALRAQFEEMKAARAAQAVRVRVQEVTTLELTEVAKAYKARGEDEPADQTLWIVSAATVDPHFTPSQLERLRKRDRSGESMVGQLVVAVSQLQQGLPVPSSPAPSDGSRA